MGASVPCGLQPWGPGQVPKALAARGPVLSREKNLALGQGQRSPGGTPGPQCLVARLLCVGGCWRTRALVSPSLPTERPKREKKEPSSAHIAWRKNFHTAPSRALLSPAGSPFREVPFRGTVVNGIPAALSVGIMRAPAPPPQVTRPTRICAAPAGGALPSTLRYFLGGGTQLRTCTSGLSPCAGDTPALSGAVMAGTAGQEGPHAPVRWARAGNGVTSGLCALFCAPRVSAYH